MAPYFLTTLAAVLILTCPTLGYMDEDLEDETWDSWLDWTDCSVTCGTGFHIRSRTCYDNVTDDVMDMNNCTGNAYEVKPCTKVHCPVDGDWNTWQEWQSCTLSCGQGLRFRGRNCDNPAPAYGGHDCLGSAQDFEACKLRECPVDGRWSKWTHWSTCSSSCEAGRRTRQRTCSNPAPAYGGSDCVGDSSQSTPCFVSVMCPVDGRWTEWNNWSVCDKTCGTGSRTRTRMCSNPAPKYNGQNCVGNQAETEPCNKVGCPVDGIWTDWLPWNQCSSTGTCSGTQRKLRLCTNPKPANGGQFCPGEFEKFQPCHLDPAATNCTQDGGWTKWGQWDSCHVTCGHGLTGRTRSCTNPEPSGAGLPCFGDYLDSRQCDAPPCPVNGGWSDWTTWFSCSVTCGIGTHQRVRTCTNPKPQGGGMYCVGDSVEDVPCYQSDCAVDGRWSKWTHWSTCSSSCEAGRRTRQRTCSNPAPAYGGSDCVGDSSQSTPCFVSVMCPVDGRWTEWNIWSICDKTCGTGSRTRTRMCSNPAPKYNGQNCVGNQAETEPCNTVGCPVDGVWTDWLPWNQCSSTGTCSGTQRKLRLCTNPKPANGGQFCPGEFEKFQPCHLDPAATNCTQDGGWTEWGQWDSCHATCGHGITGRTRSCTNPEPSGAGLSCFGDYLDSRQCDAPPCPVDGGWSDWTTWFSCSVTCGIGTHQRVRTCTNPKPQGGGMYCVGDSVEDVPCYQSDCADTTASVSAVLG